MTEKQVKVIQEAKLKATYIRNLETRVHVMTALEYLEKELEYERARSEALLKLIKLTID